MLACNPSSPWPHEAVEAAASPPTASRKRKGHHQPKKKNQLSEGMDFRRWFEHDGLWKKAKRKLLSSEDPDPVAEEPDVPPPPKSAKTKLFDIIQEDKGPKKEQGLFRRGLFDSVRSSILKKKPKPEPLEDLEPLKLELFNGSTESQDSGLGEDSDLDVSGLTSPRTPVSGLDSLRTPTPCIAKSSSAHSVKKHVIIREPSLSKLPSVARRRKAPRMERVRIVSGPSKPSEPQVVGNVATQWCQLYQKAYNEVYQTVSGCDNFTVKLLFDVNPLCVRRDLEAMTSSEIAIVIHTIYKILYFDWIGLGLHQNLSMIVHCIQRFLLVVLDVCDELDPSDRSKFSRLFRDLLRSSEAGLYSDLSRCLDRTRHAYIQLWTSLLCTGSPVMPAGGEDQLHKELAKNRASINALQVK